MANTNHEERAFKAWIALTDVAAKRTRISYKDLAREVGVHHRASRYFLEPIQSYCLTEKLPPLTILAVNRSGRPGRGFIAWDADYVEEGERRVFDFNWANHDNPFAYANGGFTIAGLAAAMISRSVPVEEVYARVRVRGNVQAVFRAALLVLYQQQCGFCGFSFPEALEAAHIKPWGDCSPVERLDVRNGILLCRNHHALFDAGLLALDGDLRIVYTGAQPSAARNHMDEIHPARLHGRIILGPEELEYKPDREYLVHRRPRTVEATQ